MEHINYLYYHGVLQNLQKHLSQSSGSKDSLSRAIQSIENKLKNYETQPKEVERGRFLSNTFDSYLSKAKKDFKPKAS